MAQDAMKFLDLYLITFNCGRSLIQSNVFSHHLFDAKTSSPDILVFNLQEVAPIGHAFLGGSFLTPYFNAFRQAVKLADKDVKYVNIITRNLGLTAIMVFVRQELAPDIAWLQTGGVGVGLQEMGNKGAIGVRLNYGQENPVELTFVSAHLAPMEDALQRRNEDYRSIVERLVFTDVKSSKATSEDEQLEDASLMQSHRQPSDSGLGIYSPSSYLFFAGDLNYRTSVMQPSTEDVDERFPQPTTDPEDPMHFSHLLVKDQLTQQLRQGKTLQGLTEASISFPPTYKYHQDSARPVSLDDDAQTWNWASHRWPSWCDRILYLNLPVASPAKIQVHQYNALPLFASSDHRPVALSVSVPLQPISASTLPADDIRLQPPFKTDPHWQAKRSLARKEEIVVGLLAYFTTTYEGLGLLAATAIGVLGGWYTISSMLMG